MASQNLLCVEPSEETLAVIREALEPFGFAVTNITNGEEAVAWARQNLPTLVIVSVEPRKVGYAICNKFKRNNDLKNVPLILTSGEETPQQLEQHRKLKVKANEYLSKPFSVEELVERVRMVMPLEGGEAAGDDIIISSDVMDEISIGDSDIVEDVEVEAEPAGEEFEDGATRAQDASELEAMFDRETEAAFAAIRSPDEQVKPPRSLDSAAPWSVGQASWADEANAAADLEEVDARPPASSTGDKADDLFDRSQPPTRAVPDAGELDVESLVAKSAAPSDQGVGGGGAATMAAHSTADREPPAPEDFSSAPESVVWESGPPSAPPRHPTGAVASAIPDPEITAKLDRLSELETTVARLSKENEDLKTRPTSAASSRDKELLGLREIINKKDKDLLDAQDALHAKERQLLDLKDRTREHDRERRDLEERALGFEKNVLAANERNEALTSDKEKLAEREKTLKVRLEDARVEIGKSHEEVESLKRKGAATEERLRADFDRLRGELEGRIVELDERHRSELEKLGEERATNEAANEQFHQAELGQLKEGHAEALAAAQKKADDERAAVEAQAQGDLARARREQEQALASLKEEQTRQIAAEREAQQTALEGKERDHKNELLGMRRRHEDELTGAEQRAIRELGEAETRRESELAAAEEKRRADLKQRDDEHRVQIADMDRQHFQEKTTLSERHRYETDQTQARAAMAEGELAARTEELAETNRRLQGVSGDLENVRGELRDREMKLQQSQKHGSELEAKVGEYEEQIMRAYQRLKSDDHAIGRAKRALAVALSLLEERGAGVREGASPASEARTGDTDESATKESAT